MKLYHQTTVIEMCFSQNLSLQQEKVILKQYKNWNGKNCLAQFKLFSHIFLVIWLRCWEKNKMKVINAPWKWNFSIRLILNTWQNHPFFRCCWNFICYKPTVNIWRQDTLIIQLCCLDIYFLWLKNLRYWE